MIRFLNNKGFTLLEVMVAVGIFAILTVGIAEVFLFNWKGSQIVWEQLSTQNEGRKAVQDFVNEIRTANYSSAGAYPLASTTGQSITFYADIDKDTFRERIRYFKDGTVLKKGVIKPTGTPMTYDPAYETVSEEAHDVANTSSVFYYYDENYTGTQMSLSEPVDASQVRMVQIKLRLEEEPNLSPAPFNIESKAMLRTLKEN